MKTFSQFVNENLEGGELVFKASTKGGKYSIDVYKKKNANGEYYSIKEYTSGRNSGSGSETKLEDVKYQIANTITGSKDIDNINYIIEIDKLGTDKIIAEINNINSIIKSPEFKQWTSLLSEEEIKNMEIEAKEYYKSNPNQANFLRKKFFIEKFKNFK